MGTKTKLKEIIIETNILDFYGMPVDRKIFMQRIRTNLDGKMSFPGWLNGIPVVCIEGTNYRVKPHPKGILLRETKSKGVKVISYPIKQKIFKKYNEILKAI